MYIVESVGDRSQLLQHSESITRNRTACKVSVLTQCIQLAEPCLLETFSPTTLPPDPRQSKLNYLPAL